MSTRIVISNGLTPMRAMESLDSRKCVASLLQQPIEQFAIGDGTRSLVVCEDMHPLAEAASQAFYGTIRWSFHRTPYGSRSHKGLRSM
jgi:hypothetical protein